MHTTKSVAVNWEAICVVLPQPGTPLYIIQLFSNSVTYFYGAQFLSKQNKSIIKEDDDTFSIESVTVSLLNTSYLIFKT